MPFTWRALHGVTAQEGCVSGAHCIEGFTAPCVLQESSSPHLLRLAVPEALTGCVLRGSCCPTAASAAAPVHHYPGPSTTAMSPQHHCHEHYPGPRHTCLTQLQQASCLCLHPLSWAPLSPMTRPSAAQYPRHNPHDHHHSPRDHRHSPCDHRHNPHDDCELRWAPIRSGMFFSLLPM